MSSVLLATVPDLDPSYYLQRQVEANVRNKILYLIQAWAHAFRNEPKYKVVQDTYQIMKVEGEERQSIHCGIKAICVGNMSAAGNLEKNQNFPFIYQIYMT